MFINNSTQLLQNMDRRFTQRRIAKDDLHLQYLNQVTTWNQVKFNLVSLAESANCYIVRHYTNTI